MGLYLGIDFGTSTNYITQWDEVKGECVPEENLGVYGKGNFFKNIIYYESPTNCVIGELAASKGLVEPENYVTGIKRLLTKDEWTQPIKSLNWKQLTSLDIATDIFREIKTKIEDNRGKQNIDGVVISVPFKYQNNERMKIKKAAENAGLNVMGLIEEPVAAALAFGLFDNSTCGQKENVLIFDLGGGTFDVTIFNFEKKENKSRIEVITTDGHKTLGGKDIDDIICKKFVEQLKKEYNFYNFEDMDEKQRRRDLLELTSLAEKVKENLSGYESEDVFVSNLYKDAVLEMEIDVDLFNEWLKRNGFLSKIQEVLDDSLMEADLEVEDIDRIILVGGSSNIPIIKDFVADYFGKKPEAIMNPGELVGKGAGIYCGQLLNKKNDLEIIIKVSYAIGIAAGTSFDTLIPRNSMYENFSSIRQYNLKNKERCTIKIYQGNSGSDLSGCSMVGAVNVNPADFPDRIIGLQLGTDRNGIIRYRLYDKDQKMIMEGELKDV